MWSSSISLVDTGSVYDWLMIRLLLVSRVHMTETLSEDAGRGMLLQRLRRRNCDQIVRGVKSSLFKPWSISKPWMTFMTDGTRAQRGLSQGSSCRACGAGAKASYRKRRERGQRIASHHVCGRRGPRAAAPQISNRAVSDSALSGSHRESKH